MSILKDDMLKAIMPKVPQSRVDEGLGFLNDAMQEANINTVRRMSAFLTQLAHESCELKYFEEIADGTSYEGRKDLGNINPGDGTRYKGRGPIQLTGRKNYAAAGQALGIDLEGSPNEASTTEVGYRVAAWYWSSRALNARADIFDIDGITKAVNGGMLGRQQRVDYYLKGLKTLSSIPVLPL